MSTSSRHLRVPILFCCLLIASPVLAQQPDPAEEKSASPQGEAQAAPAQPANPEATANSQPAPCPPAPKCPDCPSARWGQSRVLGGHQFIFPTFVDTAFVSTYLGSRVGVASAQVANLPFGRLGRVDLEALRFAEGIDLGVRLFDGFGIFGTFAGIVNASTNSRSLIIRTGQYELSGSGGAIVKLLSREKTLLSLRANLGASRGANFTLAPLLVALGETPVATIEDVITGNLDEFLIVPFSRFNWGGSLAVAQAFNPTFSLQASLGIDFGSTTLEAFDPFLNARQDLDFSSITPALALALTGDARTIGVPLALMLEYELSRPRTTNEQTDRNQSLLQNTLAAGLFYSGRADLQTGLVAFAELGLEPVTGFTPEGEEADSDKPRIYGGTLTLRYVW